MYGCSYFNFSHQFTLPILGHIEGVVCVVWTKWSYWPEACKPHVFVESVLPLHLIQIASCGFVRFCINDRGIVPFCGVVGGCNMVGNGRLVLLGNGGTASRLSVGSIFKPVQFFFMFMKTGAKGVTLITDIHVGFGASRATNFLNDLCSWAML